MMMNGTILMRNAKPVYLLALVLSLTACKKWLDTPAPLQVDEKVVFSSEQGFKEVLNGVYLQMGCQAMYGRDMSYGLLSIVGSRRTFSSDVIHLRHPDEWCYRIGITVKLSGHDGISGSST